jgi:hypothetical protein
MSTPQGKQEYPEPKETWCDRHQTTANLTRRDALTPKLQQLRLYQPWQSNNSHLTYY